MEERSRKIWKQKHGAQSPTAVFWSLGCRPVAKATPVMPREAPVTSFGQSHIHSGSGRGARPTYVPDTAEATHAASHWVLAEPQGLGPPPSCRPRFKK